MISIEGLVSVDVLIALHANAVLLPAAAAALERTGWGELAANLTKGEAYQYLHRRRPARAIRFLGGRQLNLGIAGSTRFDPRGYDMVNGGPGTAERVITDLRAGLDAPEQQVPRSEQAEHFTVVLSGFERAISPMPAQPNIRMLVIWCTATVEGGGSGGLVIHNIGIGRSAGGFWFTLEHSDLDTGPNDPLKLRADDALVQTIGDVLTERAFIRQLLDFLDGSEPPYELAAEYAPPAVKFDALLRRRDEDGDYVPPDDDQPRRWLIDLLLLVYSGAADWSLYVTEHRAMLLIQEWCEADSRLEGWYERAAAELRGKTPAYYVRQLGEPEMVLPYLAATILAPAAA